MYIIDRFEGDYAVLEGEDQLMVRVEKSKLPSFAKEGDCIYGDEDGYAIDPEATRKRKERIRKLMSNLFE